MLDDAKKLPKMTQAEFDELYQEWKNHSFDIYDPYRLQLSDVDLSDVNLDHLHLCYCKLTNVVLPDSIMFTNLTGATITNCCQSFIRFHYCSLYLVDFVCCQFERSDCRMTNLGLISLYATQINLNLDRSEFSLEEISDYIPYSISNPINTPTLVVINGGADSYIGESVLTCDKVKLDCSIGLACPSHGSFIGWKKVFITEESACICKLEIPASARRSSALGNKCRADKAKVLEITRICDNAKIDEAKSFYDSEFIYRVGEYVSVDNFEDNRFKECAPGIHFFVDREKALNYYC